MTIRGLFHSGFTTAPSRGRIVAKRIFGAAMPHVQFREMAMRPVTAGVELKRPLIGRDRGRPALDSRATPNLKYARAKFEQWRIAHR